MLPQSVSTKRRLSRLIRDNILSKTYRVSRSRFSAVIFYQHEHLFFWNIPCSFLIYCVFNKAARPQIIYLLLTWFASWICNLWKGRYAVECENRQDSRWPTFQDSHVLCHLSSISYLVLLILNNDMTALTQSEKIWEDYEGFKFCWRTTVAWPIGVAW